MEVSNTDGVFLMKSTPNKSASRPAADKTPQKTAYKARQKTAYKRGSPPTTRAKRTGILLPGADRAADRAAAKRLGISLVHYTILRALAGGMPHTYRQIQAKTSYYSILTAQLRSDHDGSLGNLGLVKEEIDDIDGKDKLVFTITAKGSRLLASLKD